MRGRRIWSTSVIVAVRRNGLAGEVRSCNRLLAGFLLIGFHCRFRAKREFGSELCARQLSGCDVWLARRFRFSSEVPPEYLGELRRTAATSGE